jgi:hypothetical protein
MSAILPLGLTARLRDVDLWTLVQLVSLVGLAHLWKDVASRPWDNDAFGYWNAWDGGLYDIPWLDHGAYTYSPAWAQAASPWMHIQWEVAWALEVGAQLVALALLAGPFLALVIYYAPITLLEGYPNPVAATIYNGNIQIVLALAIAAAFRWPGAWALVIHAKVTPGIGLLWYIVRGEWRRFGLAVGWTAAVAAISFVIAPHLWFEWADLLRGAATANTLEKEPVLALPLLVRLALASAIIVLGARTDRFWTVPIGAMLALPAIQLGGFALAMGAVPFLIGRDRRLSMLIPSPLLRLWGIRPPDDPRQLVPPAT